MIDNPRLGQVWSCVDSVEVIIGWFDDDYAVHRTLVLVRNEELYSPYDTIMFDNVKENTLSTNEGGKYTNWVRIA